MRSNVRMLPLAGAAALLAFTACPSTTATCDAPQQTCGDECVDPTRDPRHCGGCDHPCAGGLLCEEGTCVCPEGQDCSGDECGGSCGTGQLCLDGGCYVADVLAACFHAGTVVPIVGASGTRTGPDFTGIEGPVALARLDDDHAVVVGSADSVLRVIDRRTMQETGSVPLLPTGGASPNQIVVRGTMAYVVNSYVNSVELVDLADPAHPEVAGEVSTGEGTSPSGAAFDAQGRLWVSLWLADRVVPITFQGKDGKPGEPVTVALPEGEGRPYPTGVAAVGDAVYVTLNNLDETFAPAGDGWVAQVAGDGAPARIDLGEGCRNPGFAGVQGSRLWIACAGAYLGGDGQVVALDTETATVTVRVDTGGFPARVSVDPDGEHVWVADNGSLDVLRIDAAGSFERVPACPEGTMEFAADVLAY